jgi:hypothetical protein
MGIAAAMFLAACGPDYPSRDWSGDYIARMVASSSDCAGTPLPPPLNSFQLRVTQAPNNAAAVWMNPIITLTGEFEGDRLEAEGMFREEVSLPDSLRAQTSPADSFDMIMYHLDVTFEEPEFRASYEIRTPDLRALVLGGEELRCSYRYELTGSRFEPQPLGEQPWIEDLAPAPPATLQMPADSAAAGDAIGATADSATAIGRPAESP